MTDFAKEIRGLSGAPDVTLSDEAFVARVMAECRPAPLHATSRQSWRPAWLLVATIAAAAAAVPLTAHGPHELDQRPTPRGSTAARGGASDGRTAIVQAFVVRATPASTPALLDGAELRSGDGILIRYSNPAASARYLMVFALDHDRQVHWIHPAYLDARDSPSSLKLEPRTALTVLEEVAEPDNPAPGTLHFYALLTDNPLHVKDVEARLSVSDGPIHQLFAGAQIEEWRCTWHLQ